MGGLSEGQVSAGLARPLDQGLVLVTILIRVLIISAPFSKCTNHEQFFEQLHTFMNEGKELGRCSLLVGRPRDRYIESGI